MSNYQALHRRYLEQARWTSQIRQQLYALAGLAGYNNVMEVGCGTGAVCGELPSLTSGRVIGLDIDSGAVKLAEEVNPGVQFLIGDGFHLPLATGAVDAALCHFLLLWVADPLAMLVEMARITRPGGHVMALAEPDYGGRIDFPEALQEMGALQRQSLRREGADPLLGRRLRALLHQAGLEAVFVGVLGGQWSGEGEREAFASEWETWRRDLDEELSEAELDAYRSRAERAWRSGGHILFVPTFYGMGRAP